MKFANTLEKKMAEIYGESFVGDCFLSYILAGTSAFWKRIDHSVEDYLPLVQYSKNEAKIKTNALVNTITELNSPDGSVALINFGKKISDDYPPVSYLFIKNITMNKRDFDFFSSLWEIEKTYEHSILPPHCAVHGTGAKYPLTLWVAGQDTSGNPVDYPLRTFEAEGMSGTIPVPYSPHRLYVWLDGEKRVMEQTDAALFLSPLVPAVIPAPTDFYTIENERDFLNDALLVQRYTVPDKATIEVEDWDCEIETVVPKNLKTNLLDDSHMGYLFHFRPSARFYKILVPPGFKPLVDFPYTVEFIIDKNRNTYVGGTGMLAGKFGATEGIFGSLAACILRDFWVADMAEYQRTERLISKLVGTKKKKGREKKVWKKQKRIIYLPTKRLNFSQHDRLETARAKYVKISPHTVRGHLRRLAKPEWKASKTAIENAQEFGIRLPDAHTFVRPHEKGRSSELREQLRTYRSRSALQLLYGGKG